MQYSDLKSLEKALSQQIFEAVGSDDQLRAIIGKVESEKVKSEVYGKHPDPVSYKRRGVENGLADPDNIERTGIGISGQKIQLIYENTTEGVDNLQGKEITDTIEEGRKQDWNNPDGIWSEPRPFIEPTIETLKSDNKLRSGLISILKKSGMEVK